MRPSEPLTPGPGTGAFRFTKEERLLLKRHFERLFTEGDSLRSGPLRLRYRLLALDEPYSRLTAAYPARIAFSVPKRRFKHAVDRNLLKRRLREAYRLNKAPFYENLVTAGRGAHLLVMYQSNQVVDFAAAQRHIRKLLASLPLAGPVA